MLRDTKKIHNLSSGNTYGFFPDINLSSPYHSKGWSENQTIINSKIHELIKAKFEDLPVNYQAIMNKQLKSHCKKQKEF